jgi:hypothetical protein
VLAEIVGMSILAVLRDNGMLRADFRTITALSLALFRRLFIVLVLVVWPFRAGHDQLVAVYNLVEVLWCGFKKIFTERVWSAIESFLALARQ